MSEFLGARISLISKSDIRYSGVLHSINSEDSTVSLENVISYGTEGRKGKPEEEIAPADQIYEYIVFRGSDVKDLRIEETPAPQTAPAIPNDPAILGARPRPVNNNAPQSFAQGPPGPPRGPPQGPPQQGASGFTPSMPMPPNAGWGGPGGPNGPGPSPRDFPPYQAPSGWYPPQGPGFGPNGPQWNNGNQFYPPGPPQFAPGPNGPPGPPGSVGPVGRMQQPLQQPQQQQQQQPPETASTEKPKNVAPASSELEPKSLGHPPAASRAMTKGSSVPPPSTTATTAATAPVKDANNTSRISPVVPLPAGLVNKSTTQTVAVVTNKTSESTPQASLQSATQAARAAVAKAMAGLPSGSQVPSGSTAAGNGSVAVDNLTRKVDEMRVNASHAGLDNKNDYNSNASNQSSYNNHSGNQQYPRRGRGNHFGGYRRMDVPESEFDFAQSNAKFNKEDVVKEAIASGTFEPDMNASAAVGVAGTHESSSSAASLAGGETNTPADAPVAYSKTRSFFDNISSEAKDRAAAAASSNGGRPGGREWRGEEQRKNVETFGQGSVDGGYRNNYRGRGRGRGRGGSSRGRGGTGGYRNYNNQQQQEQQ
ncbi:hypothetical protein SEPCBS119000_001041 [Sporothrix epigloea]|uniref:G2 m phase checkpoint control protein n=1 Tax=Sporothrix epigloea TaxID=1892477 RepID=A0ABP0D8J7_9PEZI